MGSKSHLWDIEGSPSSQWCHPAISSSVVPFSSCPQSFPASESFPMSQLFSSGGQSTGVSASTSVLPKNTQNWSPLGWTDWISLQSKRTLKSLLQHHSSKASILRRSAFFIVQPSHPYMTTGKTIALTRWTLVGMGRVIISILQMRKLRPVKLFTCVHSHALTPGLRSQAPGTTTQLSHPPFRTHLSGLVLPPGQCPWHNCHFFWPDS